MEFSRADLVYKYMNTTDVTHNRPSRRRFVMSVLYGAAAACLPLFALARGDYGIVGRSAPDLEIDYWIDRNGEPTGFDLAATRGSWVFLKCWQDWCPGCHSHGFPALKRIADAFLDHPHVTVVGIQTTFEGFGTNTRDKVRKIQLQYELPISMGHDAGDPDGDHRPSTMRNYRTGGTPWMILIDPRGVVVFNDFSIDAERLIDFLSQETASYVAP